MSRGSKTKTKKLFANEAHSVEFLIIWQLKQHKTYVKDELTLDLNEDKINYFILPHLARG
jgi:hypothetical protein